MITKLLLIAVTAEADAKFIHIRIITLRFRKPKQR